MVDRRTGCCAHEVSILITAAVGRCRGVEPRAKVSMMIMWPPQHGQARTGVAGSRSVTSNRRAELAAFAPPSINDLPINESERKYHWPLGRRPDDHPSLSDLGL
jgi:hypothetical protein